LSLQFKLEGGKNGQGRNHRKEEKDEAVRKPPVTNVMKNMTINYDCSKTAAHKAILLWL
jgi:hypothetical protein